MSLYALILVQFSQRFTRKALSLIYAKNLDNPIYFVGEKGGRMSDSAEKV